MGATWGLQSRPRVRQKRDHSHQEYQSKLFWVVSTIALFTFIRRRTHKYVVHTYMVKSPWLLASVWTITYPIVVTCNMSFHLGTGILFWLVQKLKLLDKKTLLARVCAALRRSTLGLVLTQPISPSPWTRPQTHPRSANPHNSDHQSIINLSNTYMLF